MHTDMAYEIIRCPLCDFEMTYVSIAGKGRITLEVAEWAQVCQAPKGAAAGDCPHLNAALVHAGLPPNTQ